MSDVNINTTVAATVTRLVASSNVKVSLKPPDSSHVLTFKSIPLSSLSSDPVKSNTIANTKNSNIKSNNTQLVDNVKKTPPDKKVSPDQLAQAVTKLNDFIQKTQRDLRFRVDERSGRVVLSVIDRQNHKVIRQIPSEEALKMARRLHQGESLTLFNTKV